MPPVLLSLHSQKFPYKCVLISYCAPYRTVIRLKLIAIASYIQLDVAICMYIQLLTFNVFLIQLTFYLSILSKWVNKQYFLFIDEHYLYEFSFRYVRIHSQCNFTYQQSPVGSYHLHCKLQPASCTLLYQALIQVNIYHIIQ